MKPIISVEEMRAWEQATWDSGITEADVIDQVGQVIARFISKRSRRDDLILLLAGKGNNGEDVRLTAKHLRGRRTILLNVQDPASAVKELNEAIEQRPTLIIDGLFGIGLNRPLSDDWKELIECINNSAAPTLSIDVPSGFSAEEGSALGHCIHAETTLTLGAVKKGLVADGASPFVGKLICKSEIGLVTLPNINGDHHSWVDEDAFPDFPPRRGADSHKGSFGHVAIIAGSKGFHGAAVLASKAATKARPGLVSVFPTNEVYLPVASQLATSMVAPWSGQLPEKVTCILFGPGLAGTEVPQEQRNQLISLWKESRLPVIADASALDWLPPSDSNPGIRVLTPHPGEAARLLALSNQEIQSDRIKSLRVISEKFGKAIVVLKGNQTLVGTCRTGPSVNGSGNASLAQGGSGDLLAGYLGGLLAQKNLQSDALRTVQFGVWRHGHIADRLEQKHSHWTLENEFLSRL